MQKYLHNFSYFFLIVFLITSCKIGTTSDKLDDQDFVGNVNYLVLGGAGNNNGVIVVVEPYKNYKASLNFNIITTKGGVNKTKTISLGTRDLKNRKIEVVQSSLKSVFSYDAEICIDGECKSINWDHDLVFNPIVSWESISCLNKSLNKTLCEADKECIFELSFCHEVGSCWKLMTKPECDSRVQCEWNGAICRQMSPCENLKTEQECKTKSECKFVQVNKAIPGNFTPFFSCMGVSCVDFTTKSECESSYLMCEWDEDILEKRIKSDSFSLAQNNCVPSYECITKTETACKDVIGCKWIADKGVCEIDY